MEDRRKRGWLQRIFSNDASVSWSRIMATIVILNVMMVWTCACIFGEGFQIHFTLEDMPLGLVGVITTMFVGRVIQSVGGTITNKINSADVEGKLGPQPEPRI